MKPFHDSDDDNRSIFEEKTIYKKEYCALQFQTCIKDKHIHTKTMSPLKANKRNLPVLGNFSSVTAYQSCS